MANIHRTRSVDKNQPDIVLAFRRVGATVCDLHGVGEGCPDLLVGHKGKNILVEVKRKDRDHGGKLTVQQELWHAGWGGVVHVVMSPEEAVDLISRYNAMSEV